MVNVLARERPGKNETDTPSKTLVVFQLVIMTN